MDRKSILQKGILRAGICILLSAAIVLGLVLPGTGMQPARPEDPLENESIREITVLKVGENISELQTVVVPNGGSAAPTEPDETNPLETDPEETQPNETVPQETESEEPDIQDGEEGNEDGNQGEEGGEELELDLAAVMTWYRYGSEPRTVTCSPSKAVAKTLNVAQLKNNELKYRFELTGADARYVEITSVSLAEGDSAYREAAEEGSVEIRLPGGSGDRNYTFQVNALAEKENEEGEPVQQEVSFLFVIRCEFSMDLGLELTWKENSGREHTVTCGPDKAQALSVQNYELNERIFPYTVRLKGSLADNAEILEAGYTTASGQHSGALDKDGGSLILDPAPGADTETYYLTFTVSAADRTVLYTYHVVYQEMLAVGLDFTWWDKGMIGHTVSCQPEGSVSERIRNNQLTAGGVPFELELTGDDAEDNGITSVTYTSEAGSGDLGRNGSGTLPMTLPEGAVSNTYCITVNALVKGQRMTFQILLHYANDVTLQMEYTVEENGGRQQRFVSCENGKSRTAEAVYDDQLTDGLLQYRMAIVGSDAENVTITHIDCFQSGSGSNLSLEENGEIRLLLENGKTGENTFTVRARDDGGDEYRFTVSIPYKHRGENNIKIETNLQDGQEIINAAKTNLTVQAWSEDDTGKVISYIPANGVDTRLTVWLDDVEISYTSTSGAKSEYDLIPENPEEGDTNEHILRIYAEDAFGNFGELELTLIGQRREAGQKIGSANIYVDMTVLGIGVVGPVKYTVLADEPISYVIAKAVMGEAADEPFGEAEDTFGWDGTYAGTLDDGFYLQSLSTGYNADALEDSIWPGSDEETVLEAIDARFGAGTGLATLWRCLYRNGLNKSGGSGSSFGEFDYTSGSGWMYSVGGTSYYPGQSMSAIYLQDGDVLTVRYTLAYGWDVGGGSPGYGSTVGYCVSAVNGSFHISHQMETRTGENGNEVHVCSCCGIVATCAHANMTWRDLEDGTHIQYCEDCRTSIGDPEYHTWDSDGDAEVHTCTLCSAEEEHAWKEIKGTNTATCTEPGTRSVRCVNCEAVREEQSPPAGHAYDGKWQFTNDLQLHYQICSRCEEVSSEEPHTFEYVAREYDNVCSKCDLQHDFDTNCSGEVQSILEATCSRIRYVCVCGNTLTLEGDAGEFEEYHDFRDGLCIYCGGEDPDYGTQDSENGDHVHEWSGWTVTVEPTEDDEGLEENTCLTCGTTQTRTLPRKEHVCSFSIPTEEKEDATCGAAGYQVMACTCGATQKVILEATGEHDAEWVGGNCEYQDYQCTVCGKVWQEPSRHDWGEDGTCSVCGEAQPEALSGAYRSLYDSKRRNYL